MGDTEEQDLETRMPDTPEDKKVEEAIDKLRIDEAGLHPQTEPTPQAEPAPQVAPQAPLGKDVETLAENGQIADSATLESLAGPAPAPADKGPGFGQRSHAWVKDRYARYRSFMDGADAKMRAGSRKAVSRTGTVLKDRTRRMREYIYVHRPDWMHVPDLSEMNWKKAGTATLIGAGALATVIGGFYGAATVYNRMVAHEERRADVSRKAGQATTQSERALTTTDYAMPPLTSTAATTSGASTSTVGAANNGTAATGTTGTTATTGTASGTSATDSAATDTAVTGTAVTGTASTAATGTQPATSPPADPSTKPDITAPPKADAPITPPARVTAPPAAPPAAPPPADGDRNAAKPEARASYNTHKSIFKTSGGYMANPGAIIIEDGTERLIELSTRQRGLPRVGEPYTLDSTLEGTKLKIRGVMATELEGSWSKHEVTTVYLKDGFRLHLPDDARTVSASLSPTFNSEEYITQARSLDDELTISRGELKQDSIIVYDIAVRDADGTIAQSVKVPIYFIIGEEPERQAKPSAGYKAPEAGASSAASAVEIPEADAYAQGGADEPQPGISHNSDLPGDDTAWDIPRQAEDPIYESSPAQAAAPVEVQASAPSVEIPPLEQIVKEPEPTAPMAEKAYAAPQAAASAAISSPPVQFDYSEQSPGVTAPKTDAPAFDHSPKAEPNPSIEASAAFEYGDSAPRQNTIQHKDQGITEYVLSPEERRLLGEVKAVFDDLQGERFASEAERIQHVERGLTLVQDLHKYCDEKKTCGTPDGYDREQVMRIGRAKTAIHNKDKGLFERIMHEYAFQAQAMEETVIGKIIDKDVKFDY